MTGCLLAAELERAVMADVRAALHKSAAPAVSRYWYNEADQGSDPQSQQAPGHKVLYGGPYGAVGSYHVPLTQLGEQGVVEAPPEDEPFFTDLSNLEPVYDYKSKSRYQTGRVVYYQTRYNPTEPLAFIACLLVGVAVCYPLADQDPHSSPVKQYWHDGQWISGQGDGSSGQQTPGKVVYGGPYSVGGTSRHVPLTQLGDQGVVEAPTEDEPFFTDTSDLEPVYDFKSKSQYSHGRVLYYQTRYNPTEPLYDVLYGRQYVPTQTDQQYVKY
ncbi:uncharacterized protein LOC114464293 [Gouania willdenowi]|uniref:uncharacterized protein LOC114464293 n=1 Tax=Gouania willdenowi TaxID=441366 RepID=UPI00105673E2|nr:uncharacterized protein LOC114464293 [Gouania willdenowi]